MGLEFDKFVSNTNQRDIKKLDVLPMSFDSDCVADVTVNKSEDFQYREQDMVLKCHLDT